MNYKLIGNILGKVLLAEGGLLFLPLIAALCFGESALPFVVPMIFLFIIGAVLAKIKPDSDNLFAKEGFVCVGLSWILMSVFGALPFVISKDIPSYLNALFETVSGFTTTGASILENPEILSRGCMFWRLFTHWIGGMGVLVFIAAILPVSGAHYIHIMRAEVPGPTVNKIMPRVRQTARILYLIYLVLTVVECIFLLFGGMSFYDAILHSFATAGTGGFSTLTTSIAGFNSVYIEMVISVFMFLFGCNFNLFYLIIMGQGLQALKSEEFRVYIGIVIGSVIVIAANIASSVGGFLSGLRYSFFQVTSIITTTGFSSCDFDRWPELSRWILVILMFIGGCAGSTAGGLKVSRIIILFKSYMAELKRMILPSRIVTVRLEQKPVENEKIRGIHVFFTVYIAIAAISVLILSLNGTDMVTNITASVACISNVGPGLSGVGPAFSYFLFSPLSKITLIIEMLLGRLEIFPLLLLFTPSIWKRK